MERKKKKKEQTKGRSLDFCLWGGGSIFTNSKYVEKTTVYVGQGTRHIYPVLTRPCRVTFPAFRVVVLSKTRLVFTRYRNRRYCLLYD